MNFEKVWCKNNTRSLCPASSSRFRERVKKAILLFQNKTPNWAHIRITSTQIRKHNISK